MTDLKTTVFLGFLTLLLVGCANLKQNCPSDPFDSAAPAYCKFLVTEDEQKDAVGTVKQQGTVLTSEQEALEQQERDRQKSLDSTHDQIAGLKMDLNRQEKRLRQAEARLSQLKLEGTKSSTQLKAIEDRIAVVNKKIREARAIKGSTPADAAKLQQLRDELNAELDRLLDL